MRRVLGIMVALLLLASLATQAQGGTGQDGAGRDGMGQDGTAQDDGWVDRKYETEVSFDIDEDDCGDEVEKRIAVPYPSRNVKVTRPDKGDRLEDDDQGVAIARVKEVDVNQGTDPYAHEVVIEIQPFICIENDDLETEDIDVEVEYEAPASGAAPTPRPGSPSTPGSGSSPTHSGPCFEAFVTVSQLRTLRTSCKYARDLVLRYRRTLRTRGRHTLPPWVCFDSRASGGRNVTCRGPAGRRMAFTIRG